jgi:predicted RNA binding protein YcfA (HicA-like mRNA interferase family)
VRFCVALARGLKWRQFKHPIRPGRVTVAGKPSDELALGTLRSIYHVRH